MRFLSRALSAVAVAVMLASCGGGTQSEEFVPTRLIAFGDELSLLTADGHNYGVNAIVTTTNPDGTTTTAFDCRTYKAWMQQVAAGFGFVFKECNPGNVASPQAIQYAAANARVADVAAQITTHGDGKFSEKDLVTVFVGMHDVLDAYALYPGTPESQLVARVEAAGRDLAAQVNRIAQANGRVLFVTVHDLGTTPFARAQKAANTDTDRAALLSRLTDRFNAGLKIGVINDGRRIGLVSLDELSKAVALAGTGSGFANVLDAACTTAPPACTTQTVVTAANGSGLTYAWADDLRPSAGMHSRLGQLAENRARSNPF